jgi:hypothetical protein
MQPAFDLDKIKFSVDSPTYARARELYESGRVINMFSDRAGFGATVLGSKPYRVFVSAKHFDVGGCDCYLGQNDTLCKHMVALAIKISVGEDAQDLEQHNELLCSNKLGQLSAEDLLTVKKSRDSAIRYIKYYDGPSKTWFAYQNSLEEGCNRLRSLFSSLPVSRQTCKVIVTSLIKIDKKLCTGVDDSNGTVGGFIQETVAMLKEYAALDPACIDEFYAFTRIRSCFDWEVPLVELINERNRNRPR